MGGEGDQLSCSDGGRPGWVAAGRDETYTCSVNVIIYKYGLLFHECLSVCVCDILFQGVCQRRGRQSITATAGEGTEGGGGRGGASDLPVRRREGRVGIWWASWSAHCAGSPFAVHAISRREHFAMRLACSHPTQEIPL